MKNQVNESAKIEQLLGELGTISPPFLNNKETLKRLASELYILADLLKPQDIVEDATETVSRPLQNPGFHIPNLQPNHTDWSNPVPEPEPEEDSTEISAVTPSQVHTPEIPPAKPEEKLPEHPAEPVLPPAPQIHTPEIPPAKPEEKLPEHPAEPVLTSTPKAPAQEIPPARPLIRPEVNTATPETGSSKRDLHKALPLVKRIEFLNRLFSGKDDEWQQFCRQVNSATHAEAALNAYREHFIRLGWEKNADSAEQLKQAIVKLCA